jgi:CBS domain-containing protein
MKIRDIMVADTISVSPEVPISEVADILFSNRFHGLPVVEKEKVVGIITEDDFFLKNYDEIYLPSYNRFLKENKSVANLPEDIKDKIEKILGTKAKDIMTADCLTVDPEMDVAELMRLVKETKFTTFPVVDGENNIRGIVTLSDVLGTVKSGSIEMKKAFNGKFKNKAVAELVKEVDVLWKEKLVIMSKKQVRTWKGLVFISTIAAIGFAALFYVITSSRNNCEIEQKDVYPINCQRFSYSDWGACEADGTQSREISERFPKDCAGGLPEVVRRCQ